MMRYRDIYMKTIDKWGEQHFARGKVEKNVVVDELADVFLMVGQLTYMFGEDDLHAAVENKIAKLKLLLEE
jgi:hypothetical protein